MFRMNASVIIQNFCPDDDRSIQSKPQLSLFFDLKLVSEYSLFRNQLRSNHFKTTKLTVYSKVLPKCGTIFM